jgi:hypothetical protein
MRPPIVLAALVALGTLVIELAWVLTVPPYRGSDEFDHVYRAASVAHGYWRPEQVASPEGRGLLIPVPRKIVTDGTKMCSSYDYTGPANCRPVETLDNGLVTVASAASLYHPAFYWLIGTPALPFTGVDALYAMRVAGALLCAFLVGLAAWASIITSRTVWPLASLVLALTPVTLYSMAIPAPNGIELAAALCVWVSLVGILRADSSFVATNGLALVLGVGGVVLATVRTLGPLWLGLIVLTCLVAGDRRTSRNVLRGPTRAQLLAVAAIGLAVCASAWWVISQRQVASLERIGPVDTNPWGPALREVPLWVFQSVAAFPLRDEPAPLIVYALSMAILGVLLCVAIWGGARRDRWVLLAISVAALAVPFVITVATVRVVGTFWQGRYSLPFAFGVVVLAGVMIDRFRLHSRVVRIVILITAATLSVVHVTGAAAVHTRELTKGVMGDDPRWVTAPTWAVAALMLAGVALWTRALVLKADGDRVASRPTVSADQEDHPESTLRSSAT